MLALAFLILSWKQRSLKDNPGPENMTGVTAKGAAGDVFFPMIGLNLTYMPWDLGISIGGLLISSYSKELFAGSEATKFSISKSFGNYQR